MKTCCRCKENKDFIFYGKSKRYKDGLNKRCKDCERERYKKYYIENSEKIRIKKNENKTRLKNIDCEKYKLKRKEYDKNSYNRNKEKILLKVKEYGKKNRHKINYRIKKRFETDVVFRIKKRIQTNIRKLFYLKKIPKKSNTFDILGCDFEFFKQYIESQFTNGMNWDNIHLDHIKPLALARTEKEVYDFNHYTNFQPLFAKDNILKGDKLITKQLKLL
jgi:hypothetical protein